jgi:DNA-directed DNA polymerase III PolC
MNDFVHLEVQSAFSFLWGTFTPEALVEETVGLGQTAVALTDEGVHGAIRFYKAAVKAGIQPIIGAKVSIWDGSPLILLAIDYQGYGNLCRLLSLAIEGGTSQKNLLTKQDLSHWSKGLICLAGGRGSTIKTSLGKGRIEAARQSLTEIRQVLHEKERLFLILQNHAQPEESVKEAYLVMEQALEVSTSLGIPVVATNEVTFLKPEDYLIHKTLVGIQKHHHHRMIQLLPNDRYFLASSSEMERRIPYHEAIENTALIATLCRGFSFPIGRLHPPSLHFTSEASRDLSILAYKEAAKRYCPIQTHYLRQIDHELSVIDQLKLADFFLLIRKVVEFARREGIRHSVRGSAASSLVIHLLLGGVDPIRHDLLFERFINEGRRDLPDIDVDFDSNRRDEVIRHLMSLFPRQTAMVSTIHTFKVRSAVRLAARSLGYPLAEIDRLATCLPWSLRGRDLNEALANLPELQDSPLKNEDRLIEMAAKLTGLPSQCSMHLGGVLIAPRDVKDWTPVGLSPHGIPVGQLDKDDVDALGLLKLDILGLRMHTAIRKALEVLQKQGIFLDLDRMPLDDKKTYALLRSTESLGVFQLESPGQRSLLGHLQPTHFGDLISEISLFRPGPVEGDMVDVYVRRRNGQEPVKIPHDDLVPILSETYGVILFQEQVLRIVHTFAGLSYSDADLFRRAMTKDRKSGAMDSLKRQFMQGAMKKGYSRILAEHMFERIAAFASFGFCKAHAASFAHITYQSAYLKAHHQQAFSIGFLNAGQVGSYPPYVILNEARRKGIPVYPPHVNYSGLDYEAEGRGIRVPLWVINGVGTATARRIIAERERRGLFESLQDFLVRFSPPERIAQVLTSAGALEDLSEEFGLIREVCNA